MSVSVESSVISTVDTKGADLIINFKNGNTYKYLGAAKELDPLTKAESKGRYFLANIKENYSFSKN
tara:strand:- start:431 stop:628 length:198 start_codon:yes stop_codon:yes gene_type:complete